MTRLLIVRDSGRPMLPSSFHAYFLILVDFVLHSRFFDSCLQVTSVAPNLLSGISSYVTSNVLRRSLADSDLELSIVDCLLNEIGDNIFLNLHLVGLHN